MKFDKKIKNLFHDVDIPESYDKRVDEVLSQLDDKETAPRKKHIWKLAFGLGACLLFLGGFLFFGKFDMEADLITYLKETIIDFLKGDSDIDTDESGVESNRMYVEGRQDLLLQLQETVIDTHNIYLLIQITAPANIKFCEEIGFDYICFCKGANYSNNQLLGGAGSCRLLEVDSKKPNIATYVVSQTIDDEIEEDSEVTVSLKDMVKNVNSDKPKMLVEGMWSVTFPFQSTVNCTQIKGTPDMTFSFLDTTAAVEGIELTPLGIVLRTDVSNVGEELAVSDTTIAIRLKMADGEEQAVVSHDLDEDVLAQGGSGSVSEENGKTYQQDVLEFRDMIDVSQVEGIYIEDLYVPIE